MTLRSRIVGLLAVLALACRPAAPPVPTPATALVADVQYLASRALAGRATGTPGSDSAAAYIAREYQRLALTGAFARACAAGAPCPPTYFQFFDADGATGRNIAVVIPGADSALRGRHVVIGAHYDHLGRSTFGAFDEALGPVIRPGADDNASGAAVVLELARRLAARPPRRSVLLAHFDAEELGLVGSRVFVEHPPVERRTIDLMLNLDMVGRLRDGPLTVDAPRTPEYVRALVDGAAGRLGLRHVYTSRLGGRSDHASFAQARIPAVMLFTGFHGDYHRASDVAAKLDLPGLARVADLAEAIVRGAADREVEGAPAP